MSRKTGFLHSSIGKKVVMGLTGLFLVSFLVVHCFLNSLIFFNDNGLTFNEGAHFMGHNWLIRAMEYVLFIGFIIHIYQSLILTLQNRKARPIAYESFNGNANSTWYSRSMGLLGTLILFFLIIHLTHFWVKSRFTGLPGEDANGRENLFAVMLETFSMAWVVILYVLAMVSLSFHLMHGFQSAFQSLGLNHRKYTPFIKRFGLWFSIIIPIIFAAMPLSVFFGLIK
jgi:succinate dehydrogenase / fumarate reductase, cytochrome b subunit